MSVPASRLPRCAVADEVHPAIRAFMTLFCLFAFAFICHHWELDEEFTDELEQRAVPLCAVALLPDAGPSLERQLLDR